jgi:hypothetical protein
MAMQNHIGTLALRKRNPRLDRARDACVADGAEGACLRYRRSPLKRSFMKPSEFATLVPSQRDFLQAVRTGKKGVALVPCLGVEDVAREALRMTESGVTALAMRSAALEMAEAARATRVPMLSLGVLRTAGEALDARAHGADAVLLDPGASDSDRDAAAAQARATRMVALPLARTPAEVERAVSRGARALVVQAADARAITSLASAAPRLLVLAWPTSPLSDGLERLRGVVDAVVVDVDVYGETGFERLVSELNP